MIHIDNNNKNPKYKQIAECIKKDIVTGELAANQNLISIRALAENLNVSTITVKKAYKDLESKYIIVSCPRQHYKITDASLTIIQKEKKKELKEINNYLLKSLKLYNLDYKDIN